MISSMKLLCWFNMVNYCFYKNCLFNFRCMLIILFFFCIQFPGIGYFEMLINNLSAVWNAVKTNHDHSCARISMSSWVK